MGKFAQGKYQVKNLEKYLGNKNPLYRSSWEFQFMKFCDEHPAILKWASEAIKIPYKNPFTGKYTIYVPDFFINYIDAQGKTHTELIEVKPKSQMTMENAKRNTRDQAHVVLNAAKWEAARAWSKQNGVTFRIVTEDDIFHSGRR